MAERNTLGYPDNCPPRKMVSRLELGLGLRLGLVLALRGNQTIAPEENCPPVMVRVWVRVGGQFSLGAIALEPNLSLIKCISSISVKLLSQHLEMQSRFSYIITRKFTKNILQNKSVV